MSEPIRIAQIIGTLPGGGVKNVIYNYYRYIDKNKYQFDFYYDSKNDVELPQDIIDMGARFYRIANHKNIFSCVKQLRKYFKENQYQIVHSGMNSLSFVSLYAAKKENVKIRIAHNHSVPGGNEYFKNIIKNIFKHLSQYYANVYFACSKYAAKWMFGDEETYIMVNAIDFDKFKEVNQDKVNELINKYQLDNKFIIGNIGRLTYAKNHKFLIDIFKELKTRIKNAHLLIVGDGELKEDLYKYIKDNNLSNCVTITGYVEDVELYYHLLDVEVCPSFYEGVPLNIIEAQASAVPIVISENIIDEVVICDRGLRQLQLKDDVEKWVDTIIDIKDVDVILNDKANEYHIKKQVELLEKEYDLLRRKYL